MELSTYAVDGDQYEATPVTGGRVPTEWLAGEPDSFLQLGAAVKQGLVKEADLDRALRRLIHAQMKLGVFDPPDRLPWAGYTYAGIVNSAKHQQLALEAAREAIVLLKNDGNTLPLRRDGGSIAVIGPNADEAEVLVGNYNGTPVAPAARAARADRRSGCTGPGADSAGTTTTGGSRAGAPGRAPAPSAVPPWRRATRRWGGAPRRPPRRARRRAPPPPRAPTGRCAAPRGVRHRRR